MRKFYFSFLILILSGILASAQYAPQNQFPPRIVEYPNVLKDIQQGPVTIDTLQSLQQAINVLFGPGVSVTNLTYSGPSISIGTFIDTSTVLLDPNADFGIDTGLIMSTGNIYDAPGPNSSASISTANNLPGDPLLDALCGSPTYDASILEFDFTPLTDTLIACKYIFASEEYLEYVGSTFNDVFGFFINGPGFSTDENLAVIDSVFCSSGYSYNVPVTINTINNIDNSNYFVYNNWDIVEYDGYTKPFIMVRPVFLGQPYHFKIAVADAGDMVFDAAVFMEAGSFLGYASVPNSGFTYNVSGTSVAFSNITNYATGYSWSFGDGTSSEEVNPIHEYSQSGTYTVIMTAYNYYQSDRTEQQIIVGEPSIINDNNSLPVTLIPEGNGIYCLNIPSDVNDNYLLNIYSLSGQLIQSKQFAGSQITEKIDLSNLAHGMYSVKVTSSSKNTLIKLFK